jgi:hypothetical protein
MDRDQSSKPAGHENDESTVGEQKKSPVNRRSFSFLAASVPAVFALSCKTSNTDSSLRDAGDGKDGGDTKFGKNTNFTTAAFGEEGGKDVNATTRQLGEEGGATTRALGEEGGKGGFATTQAVNEEGGPGVGDEKWGPVVTTQALNEESSGDNDDLGKVPTITTRKLKEEGGADSKHIMTSMALGEEGGKAGGGADGGKNGGGKNGGGKNGGGKNGGGMNLADDKNGKQLVTTQAVAEEGGKKNNIVTTQAVAEEGGNNGKKDVVLTSAALGEEGTGNKDDLYLSTRALHEEGSNKDDIDRVKDVRATSLAVGEEGGGFNLSGAPESSGGGLPSQQVAMIIIQGICNELGIDILEVDIETRLTRTQKELLWIKYTFETLTEEESVAHDVTIKWLEDWTEDQFAMFAKAQIKNKLGLK